MWQRRWSDAGVPDDGPVLPEPPRDAGGAEGAEVGDERDQEGAKGGEEGKHKGLQGRAEATRESHAGQQAEPNQDSLKRAAVHCCVDRQVFGSALDQCRLLNN